MRLFLIVVATWTAVLATSKSDSHENWSNEKAFPAYSYIYEIKEDVRGNQGREGARGSRVDDVSYAADETHYMSNAKHSPGQTQNASASKEEGTATVYTSIESSENNTEKNGNQANSEHRPSVQIIQPYVVNLEKKPAALEATRSPVPDEALDELSRPVRTSANTSNSTFTVEYSPPQELRYEDPLNPATRHEKSIRRGNVDSAEFPSAEFVDLETVGGFGQRVRSSYNVKEISKERPERTKSKISLDGIGSPFEAAVDFKKYYRGKNVRGRRPFSSFYEVNDSESNPRAAISLSPLEDLYRLPPVSTSNGDSHENLKDDRSVSDYFDYVQGSKEETSYLKDEESQETISREQISPNYELRESESLPLNLRETSSNKSRASNQGKLSRPIVVPELPGYKTTSYSVTKDYSISNDVPSTPIPALPKTETNQQVETIRPKTIEENYLSSSSVILNPLRVGVSLMNAQELFNNSAKPSKVLKEYIPDDPEYVESVASESKGKDKNETGGQYEIEFQEDELLQQEQIAKEVTQKSPVQSVEIQKSVEVYHTAPIQEIHYPVEYVPNQQKLGKNRFEDLKDSSHFQQSIQASGTKDRRPDHANFGIYKSNEVLEENVVPPPVQQQERNRYEYNGNENDVNKVLPPSSSPGVIYIPVGGVDRNVISTTEKNFEKNHVFRTRDQYDDTLHEQTNTQHSLSGVPTQLRTKAAPIRQEVGKELSKRVPDFVNAPQMDYIPQEPVHSTRPGQILENPVNPLPVEPKFLLPIPQPYPVEKVVEKTIHVPHMVEVEKLIEKKVPYPVEKVVEKQVSIPQPFPVHIQVPVDRIVEKQIRIPHLYPIHIERVIEKKVPFAVQRFIIQPYPVHIKVPQPVHVPVPIEKVIEKTVHVPRPYPIDLPKYVQPLPNQQSYSLQYEPSQLKMPSHYQTTSIPNYGNVNDDDVLADTSQFYGNSFAYASQSRAPARQPGHHPMSKKFGGYGNYHPYSGLNAYSTLVGNSGSFRRQGVQVNGDKEKSKDDYRGHPHRAAAGPLGLQTKASQYGSADQLLVNAASFRRARQESGAGANTGTFRQSKMEYGFKPPMVPSVQYDEKTASKVDR